MSLTIAIIGGGYIGCAAAIQLSRQASQPLEIAIIEPAANLGSGVAFAADDPDHRLNAPTRVHFLYPENTESFGEWHAASGTRDSDPESLDDLGRVFARRADFGKYVARELANHRRKNPSGSIITHYRDTATGLTPQDSGWSVKLKSGDEIDAAVVLVTPCNLSPTVPAPFRNHGEHPAIYANPWDLKRLGDMAPDARVLIVGTGLTMADVTVTLMRDGPERRITAISRRGLFPQPQRRHPPSESVWEALTQAIPAFVERHNLPKTVSAILRAHRADITALAEQGIEWQVAFDELRDAAHCLWPNLPAAEQQRYFRHLSPWYETHRFRLPPQTGAKLEAWQKNGRLEYRAGFITNVANEGNNLRVGLRARGQTAVDEERFDAVVNCTGPERDPTKTGNPFLIQLVKCGLATASPFAMGLEVDGDCRSLATDGTALESLRILGPLTRSRFGEINGIPTIAQQVYRITSKISAAMERAC